MNINRHNYEEFFLMYVDNELTNAQRTEVETFVQQNPDLSEELAMLQDTVLVPDNITFSKKEALYKDEHSINIDNYEEYFLLDVDNELPASKKAEVEKFVLQHPKLQDEFTLLHQTRLEPEVIEFKDKSILYRTEKKERRVIPMNFMRFAVAASVIGLVATLWIVLPGKVETAQPIASAEKTAITTDNNTQPVQPGNDAIVVVEETTSSVEPQVASNKLPAENRKPSNNIISTAVNKTPVVENEKPEEIFASVTPRQEITRENTYTEVTNPVITEPAMAINASNKNVNNISASSARPAVYKEVETDDEDNSFYIGSVEINKNKLRGLIKKASTLFDKKSNNNDSERTIQIASFEIKTK